MSPSHPSADYHTCPHIVKLKQETDLAQIRALARHLHYLQRRRRISSPRAVPSCHTCGDVFGRIHVCASCVTFSCWKQQHARAHYESTKHVLAVDLVQHQVFCFECNDYVYDKDVDRIITRERNAAQVEGMQLVDPKPNRIPYEEWQPSTEELNLLEKKAIKKSRINDYKSSYGLRGLNNLGNTCFMSVILQTFIHNPPLRNYFLSDQHNSKTCPVRNQDSKKVCLACEMNQLYKQFFSGEIRPYSPHQLLHSVWTHAHHLAGYEQQDAHEFFIAFLNGLHINCQGTMKNCTCIIHRIFTGAIRSDLRCLKCGYISTTVDPFWDISLDLHEHREKTGEVSTVVREKDGVPHSLVDCLKRFTNPERLGSDQKMLCQQCNSHEERTKQLSLKHLPIVVCFHLKRFEHFSHSTKIKTSIDFPAHLNIAPYLSSTIVKKREKADADSALESDTLDDGTSPNTNYSLFAVVNHHGSLHSGHYTSFVQHTDQWFKCDDASITTATLEQVLSSEGYLLFYIKDNLEYEQSDLSRD